MPALSPMDVEVLDSGWYMHLRRARCERDVIASVREFLESLSVHELSRLPIRCLEVTTAVDIPRLSSYLAATYEGLPPHAEDRAIYVRTIAFLCYATDRLSQVPSESPETWETPM